MGGGRGSLDFERDFFFLGARLFLFFISSNLVVLFFNLFFIFVERKEEKKSVVFSQSVRYQINIKSIGTTPYIHIKSNQKSTERQTSKLTEKIHSFLFFSFSVSFFL